MKRIRANGIEFACLEQGSGPLVVLLHGYPDNAHSWSRQMPALAEAGYRVVAPNTRGYPPTEIPADGFYDRGTLATDVAELIRAFGGGEPACLVGQDWGAVVTYSVIAAFPELVRRAVVMAVPHPAVIGATLLDAAQVHRSFHWWFFQVADFPEMALAANNFAFIDYLWKFWTSAGYEDAEHIAGIKRMLAEPGAVAATLGYYRAMIDRSRMDPCLDDVRDAIARPIGVPTLAICGGDDSRGELMKEQAGYFRGEYRYEVVPGAGHFVHREKPSEVNALLLDWLGSGTIPVVPDPIPLVPDPIT
ncbi:MAG TPA: alpha/beta hydrolase [Candidatus Binatia bacterium]